jgi:hypothetical protein
MPFEKAKVDIRSQIEPATGGRIGQNLAGYKVAGINISAATVTSGYLYSNETYAPTGYKKGGAQLVFPKIGCRPGAKQLLYSFQNDSYSAVTKYVNCFSDGESWVSDASGVRSGTKISKKLSAWDSSENLPCGMLYSVCCLVGAGGGGGAAGLLVNYDNNGGSGGVAFFVSRWLRPSTGVDTVTIQLGEKGKGAAKGALNAGAVGGTSYMAGRVQITGGGRATGGSSNAPSQTSTISDPWSGAYGQIFTSFNGSDTSGTMTISTAFPSPEGGSITSTARWGGAAGSGAGYGAAGDGNPAGIRIWY